MFDLWKEELSEEETAQLIEKMVMEVTRRKLNAPAVLFLESHKPLAYLGSQAAIAFAPFLVPFVGFDNVNNYSRLLADRKNVDTLVDQLVIAANKEEKKSKPEEQDESVKGLE
jgi:hypothetical protein